jgi:hypothetical protein
MFVAGNMVAGMQAAAARLGILIGARLIRLAAWRRGGKFLAILQLQHTGSWPLSPTMQTGFFARSGRHPIPDPVSAVAGKSR